MRQKQDMVRRRYIYSLIDRENGKECGHKIERETEMTKWYKFKLSRG